LLLGDGTFLSLAQIRVCPNVFGGVDLLTLSACKHGKRGAGAAPTAKEVEGFGVLAQRQGAKAVVASLWPVADRSHQRIDADFYRVREAKAGPAKPKRCGRRKLKLLREEK